MHIFGQLKNAQFEFFATDPTGTELKEGRVWYNTTTDSFKCYDGSQVHEFNIRPASRTVTIANSQSTRLNISNMSMNPSTTSLAVFAYSVRRVTSTDLRQESGEIALYLDGSSVKMKRSTYNSSGALIPSFKSGTNFDLECSPQGQVSYISDNLPGGGYNGYMNFSLTESIDR